MLAAFHLLLGNRWKGIYLSFFIHSPKLVSIVAWQFQQLCSFSFLTISIHLNAAQNNSLSSCISFYWPHFQNAFCILLSTVNCIFLLPSILLTNFDSNLKSLFLLTIFSYKKSYKHLSSHTSKKIKSAISYCISHLLLFWSQLCH